MKVRILFMTVAAVTLLISVADAQVAMSGISFGIESYGYHYGRVYYEKHDGTTGTVNNVVWGAFKSTTPGWQWGVGKHWYCVDIEHGHSNSPQDWTVYPTNYPSLDTIVYEFNGTMDGLALAANIYNNNWYANRSTAAGRATVQLAIWEALYDYSSGASTGWYDLTDGSFYVDVASLGTNQSNAYDAIDQNVESMLAAATESGTAGYWEDTQNLIGQEVPEPTVLMLFGVGLVGVGITVARRRRS